MISSASWVKPAIVTANNNREVRTVDANFFSVSEVARLLGAKPRNISDLFYSRQLRDDIAPIVAGRRLIPAEYVEVIRTVLQRNNRQVAEEPVHAT